MASNSREHTESETRVRSSEAIEIEILSVQVVCAIHLLLEEIGGPRAVSVPTRSTL